MVDRPQGENLTMKMTSMRLQKIIARSGRASRREAERLIKAGRVTVNDVCVTELGTKATPSKDIIKVDGEEIYCEEEILYVMLYKPQHWITSLRDPENRPCVGDILEKWPARLYPVGRLDYDAEGLLVCTNDGELAFRMQHPSFGVEKTYEVKFAGKLSENSLSQLRKGVKLREGIARVDKIEILKFTEKNTWVMLTLHQGWNRQIKRMAQAIRHRTLKIKRVGFGPLRLSRLKPGESRKLMANEVKQLYETVRLNQHGWTKSSAATPEHKNRDCDA